MSKEIIGYKLIKPEYEDLVVKSLGLSTRHAPNLIIAGMIDYYLPKIKELNILDWFESVYDEEEFKIKDWICREWGDGDIDLFQIKSIKVNNFIYTGTYYRNGKPLSGACGNPLPKKDIRCTYRLATLKEIKLVQYPQITINSFKGEFQDNKVIFGCAEIGSQLFINLHRVIEEKKYYLTSGNSKFIETITIGKGTFTKDQIKEIAEYYLNKG